MTKIGTFFASMSDWAGLGVFFRKQWDQRLFNALILIRSVLHNSSTQFQAKLIADRPEKKQLVHKILSVYMV